MSEHHDLVVRHCERIRRCEGLAQAVIVFAFECNLGFEAQHLIRAVTLSKLRGWLLMREGPGGAPGWLTTNGTKEKSCLTMRSSLELGKIWLHRDFFSCSLAERQARSRLRDELARFSVITQPPATPFGQSKRTFTGKVSGQQDDLAVATMIAVEAGVTFFQSDKYRDFAYQR